MVGSVFAVPVGELPPSLWEVLPARSKPVVVAGRVPVSVAFVSYEPGGVLAYEELLVAVAVRAGLAAQVTVPHIWVDSEVSVAGGRELWNIPKGMARFERRGGQRAVSVRASEEDGPELAALDARILGRLRPGWHTSSLATAQRLDGSTVVAHNAVRARPHALRTRWSFPAAGPLGYLAGRRPVLSVALADMGISFGVRTSRGRTAAPAA